MPIMCSSNILGPVVKINLRVRRGVVAVAVLLLSPLVCMGQTQLPPLVPLAQGGGAVTGKLEAGAGAASSVVNVGGLTDEPIFPGETVHITVFNAPDFSINAQVSENGDIPLPIVGVVHLAGLNSAGAEKLLTSQLKNLNLIKDPHVTVTVDSLSTGITVLGEVRDPGIYQPPGKHLLSDLIAAAGGMTANTGRVIEISNDRTPGKEMDIPWDPTMHNTNNYNLPIHPGDRVLVKACGIAYVGGHVAKPGAYSLCGSPTMTLSEVISMAGGVSAYTAEKRTVLIRTQPDGTKTAMQFDLHRILMGKEADPRVQEDDIVYVTPSPLKLATSQAIAYALTLAGPLIYVYHP